MLPCGKNLSDARSFGSDLRDTCVIADVYICEVGSNHLFCCRIYDFLKLSSCMQDW